MGNNEKSFAKTRPEEIEENLEYILKKNEPIVCTIKGKWGVGKTYFLRRFLEKSGEKYAYISLFGKDSLESIERDIVFKIAKFRKILGDISIILKQLGSVSSKVEAIGSLLSLVSTTDIRNTIVVIDDFERLSDKLNPKDIMGLIAQLKEDKECKVILILNEEILQNDKYENFKNEYDEYKEKIVDFEFLYNPSVEENFKLVEIKSVCFQEEIREFFTINNINNIRSMVQTIHIINHLCENLKDGIDISLLKEAIRYLILFIFLKKTKNYSTEETIKKLFEFNSATLTKSSENEISDDVKYVVNIFSHLKSYELFYISFFPEFVIPFFRYIDTEIITDEIINEIFEKLNEELKRREYKEIKESLKEEFENYINSIDYKDEDFISNMWGRFNKYKNSILNIFSLSELYDWMINILRKLDTENKDRYEEFFADIFIPILEKKYEEGENKFIEFVQYEHIGLDPVIKIIENIPKLKEFYEDKIREINAEKVSCEGIKIIMLRKLQRTGYNPGDERIINSLKEETLKECIKDKDFVKTLLSFVRNERKITNTSFKNFIRTFDKFIENLVRENPDIKNKIEIWKKRSGKM